MEFCRKFYEDIIKYKIVLFGLLLSLSILNGVESDCNYSQNLEPGQTYYAFNAEYPNVYKDENHCTWQMTSPYDITINCYLEINENNCYLNRLSVIFAGGNTITYCDNVTFVHEGKNPIIKLDSQYNSRGRFICEITTVSDPTNCQCGWKKMTRIVGGKETGVNEYPMMAGLVDLIQEEIFCGCTIISEQYVLTAAHCLQNKYMKEISVIVGEHDTTTGEDTNATKLFPLAECIIHPEYQNNRENYNDIAICKIVGIIKYSAEVGPVCLPFQHRQNSFLNNNVTALGWGLLQFAGPKSNTLQKVDLNVVPLKQCESYFIVSDSNICTFTQGKDTCQMDSGGPFLWQDPITRRIVLIGIVSAGVGCASTYPSVGMRVGAYIDWINSVTDTEYCQIE